MAYLVIRHKVKDFAAWKPAFDKHGETRATAGGKGGWLLRAADDRNNLMIAFEWDSIANAKKFVASEDLKRVMKEAGVIDKPDIYFLEEVEKFEK